MESSINRMNLVIKDTYYDYYPGFFPDTIFFPLFKELNDKCVKNASRFSCTFSNGAVGDSKSQLFSYSLIPSFTWESSTTINMIKTVLENKLKTHFDYCLAHVYPDGTSHIPWHNDKEALKTDIVSVSFGATRKFRFRQIGETKGCCKEFYLNNGDFIHMLEGCQKVFEHCVPVEKKVTNPRINLTFRKLE